MSAVVAAAAVPQRARGSNRWAFWGTMMVVPYLLVFLVFVSIPVCYGLWLARHPASYEKLFDDPIFFRTAINTIVFIVVAINLKMAGGAAALGLPDPAALVDQGALADLHPAVGGAVDPDHPLGALHAQPGVGRHQQHPVPLLPHRRARTGSTTDARARLLDADAHLEVAAVLDADPRRRPAGDPAEQYEAASVDGATSWQKFRFITWPSMKTLYLTSTILSMIWTLGDFNSVYLLTGGGPADLTHVLATIGIRYLRLDLVDLAMASIVVALPLVLPLVYFMMKRLSK
jgi:multiple sugar transport system permease protein